VTVLVGAGPEILDDLAQEAPPIGPEGPLEEGHLEPTPVGIGLLPPEHVVDELRQAVLDVVGGSPRVI